MKQLAKYLLTSLITTILLAACGSQTAKSPYSNSPEEQRAKARQAQQELSRETSRN